ncbi:hypothetical protein P0F65_14690 [Sphingomonas sp. I4]
MSLIDRRQGLWGLAVLGLASTLPLAWRRAQAATPARELAVVEKGRGASPSTACPTGVCSAVFRWGPSRTRWSPTRLAASPISAAMGSRAGSSAAMAGISSGSSTWRRASWRAPSTCRRIAAGTGCDWMRRAACMRCPRATAASPASTPPPPPRGRTG